MAKKFSDAVQPLTCTLTIFATFTSLSLGRVRQNHKTQVDGAACRHLDATVDEEGNPTYADLFGGTFMELVRKSDARYRGQFFTPWNVACMMAQMTMMGSRTN